MGDSAQAGKVHPGHGLRVVEEFGAHGPKGLQGTQIESGEGATSTREPVAQLGDVNKRRQIEARERVVVGAEESANRPNGLPAGEGDCVERGAVGETAVTHVSETCKATEVDVLQDTASA